MTTEPKNSVDELVEVDDTDLLEREEIEHDPEERRLEAQTDEGAQQLRPLAGGSRTQELVLTGGPWPDVDDTMILNMGPQHPSTHGVLRIMMELDGETVLRAKPVIGYLHTGMEKTGEELTYVQGATNVTRMDYASPLSNELVYSLAVERLLDVETPERAIWIRMLLVELNRISSHLLFQATNGMDLGAVSMMIYGWREREYTLRLLESITGLRMNHNFIRPGGVAADLPDGWQADVLELCDQVERGVAEYDTLLSENPIWRERTVGVGLITTQEALALGATGPILRSTGFAWDLRKAQPYLAYDDVDFDVIYTDERRRLRPLPDPPLRDPRVDQDRAPVRRADARWRLPRAGPQGHAAAACAHRRVDGSADPPLQALHRGLPRARGRDLRRRRVAPR